MACFAGIGTRRRSVEHALHRRHVVGLRTSGSSAAIRTNCVGTMFMYVTRSASIRRSECFGVESLHEHDGLPATRALQRVAVRRAVVEREAGEVHLVGTGEAPEVEERRVRTRAVRPGPGAGGADDGLGSAGRTRRVHAHRDEVGRRRAGDRRVGLLGERARRTRRRRGAWARDPRRVRRVAHEQHRTRVAEEVVELVGRRPPRSRHQPRPESRARQRDLDPFRTVAEHGGDRGVGADATRRAGPVPSG